MKGRFGGSEYKPKGIGPEPVVPSETRPVGSNETSEGSSARDKSALEALKSVKVPFSSRITIAADQQLKAMAREGHSQTSLLAEALNLLFKRHGKDQVA